MARTYSDPSYGSNKQMPIPGEAIAINGTVTSTTEKARVTVMSPITVNDLNVSHLVAATNVDSILLVGKSLGGTGTFSALGTVTLTGTNTANQVTDATVTSTDFVAGDDIVVARAAGTETETAWRGKVYVQYKEKYVQSDS